LLIHGNGLTTNQSISVAVVIIIMKYQ